MNEQMCWRTLTTDRHRKREKETHCKQYDNILTHKTQASHRLRPLHEYVARKNTMKTERERVVFRKMKELIKFRLSKL